MDGFDTAVLKMSSDHAAGVRFKLFFVHGPDLKAVDTIGNYSK